MTRYGKLERVRTDFLSIALQRGAPLEGRNYLDTKIHLATRYCR